MDAWGVFTDLPENGAEAVRERAAALGAEPFVAFAQARLAEASSPGLRAAYEALDGPWSDDFGFKRLLASLLFRGQAMFERALADPGCIWAMGAPDRSDELVQTLEELGVEMPAPLEQDPDARYEEIERWREEHFRPLTIEHALTGEIRDELVASSKLEVGLWGKFKARRGASVALVHFKPGRAFRGEAADDRWTPLFQPVLDAATPNREVALSGLGAFRFEVRPGRQGRHPVTGETFQLPGSTVPVFKASRELVEALLA